MESISSLRKNADTLAETGQLLEASIIYEEICTIDENDADVWSRLGDIYWQLNRHQQAASCCRKSIDLNPNNAATHHKLGIILHSSGLLPEARKSYQRALADNLIKSLGHDNAVNACYEHDWLDTLKLVQNNHSDMRCH